MNPRLQDVGGVWLPATETHMGEWMRNRNHVVDGKLTYQFHKLQTALGYCKSFRQAADVGAHCGTWSMHLVKRFDWLYAFEPVPLHREAFDLNVGNRARVYMFPCAIGERTGRVEIVEYPESTGSAHVSLETKAGNAGSALLRPLDLFGLLELDFIKFDVEGYELPAVKGAMQTLERNKPVIVIEQKPGRGERLGFGQMDAVKALEGIGARVREELSGDFILTW